VTAAYLLATILGVGLLLFSSFGGGDSAGDGGDVTDLAGDGAGGHDLDGGAGGASHVLIGLFSIRNITFFLAAFGSTGLLLTALDAGATRTAVLATLLGLTGLGLSHAVFTWLRRSDASVEAPGDRDFEGALGRIVLPVSSESRGQVACVIGGRECYLTAALADGVDQPLTIGQEVIIVASHNGVVRVMPASSLDLPSST
jgi:hypothetical protein